MGRTLPQHTDRSTMKVKVDTERCQGHGRCYAIAPEIFESDDLGNGVERNGGIVPPDHEATARRAAANCPEDAVIIEES